MSVAALNRSDAVDLDSSAVVPTQDLQSCNHLLGDHDALMRLAEGRSN